MRRLLSWFSRWLTVGILTIWSNCVAGWWLGGSREPGRLVWALLGCSMVFMGGRLLAESRERGRRRLDLEEEGGSGRKEETRFTEQIGWASLSFGATVLILSMSDAAVWTLLVSAAGVAQAFLGRLSPAAALLAGLTRSLVYMVGGSDGSSSPNGYLILSAVAIGIFVWGSIRLIEAVQLKQDSSGRAAWLALLTPIGLSLLLNRGEYLERALVWDLLLIVWLIPFAVAWHRRGRGAARFVEAGLTAAIPIVDAIATVDAPIFMAVLYLFFSAVSFFGRLYLAVR